MSMGDKRYFLSHDAVLKWLEEPCVYNMASDELYELDSDAFEFMKECAGLDGGRSDETSFTDFCMAEGLLACRRGKKKKIPSRQSPVPSLRYLELQVTDRCNLRCRHCYIGMGAGQEIGLEKVVHIMDEFEEMQGLRLLLTGGEPLLYSRFDELNERLPGYEFRTILFTNGLLLTDRVLERLNVHEIQVSIDGLRDAHDFIRGRGSYDRTMMAVDRAMARGFHVSVSTMIHRANLDDFDEMERMFVRMGIREWSVDVPCPAGYLENNRDILPLPAECGRYLRYGFGEGLHGGGEGYVCGLHLMSVTATGMAAQCAFFADDPVGHIDEGLHVCWSRVEHMRIEDTECDCAFLDACRGGCRYRALRWGSLLARDPYRCAAMLGE